MHKKEAFCRDGCFVQYWDVDGRHLGICSPGGFVCQLPRFAKGLVTEIHDKVLAEATLRLIEVIDQIPADPQGRLPSLIATRKGLVLAWVYHGAPPPANGIEIKHEAEIERLLGIAD